MDTQTCTVEVFLPERYLFLCPLLLTFFNAMWATFFGLGFEKFGDQAFGC